MFTLILGFFVGWVLIPQPEWAFDVQSRLVDFFRNLGSK